MIDISRKGGSQTYDSAVAGEDTGVDLCGSSMNYFVGQRVLPELLVMKMVGVYVDMPPINGQTLMDTLDLKIRPYLYIYKAEEICNWVPDLSDRPNEFREILVRETYDAIHPKYGVPYKTETRYRHMYMNEEGYCICEYFNEAGDLIDEAGEMTNMVQNLQIKRIPFVMLQLPYSLLKATSKYQVALLNIASSDINYILKANFPFYTEQRDYAARSPHTEGGTDQDIDVGVTSGRAYGRNLERPGFIHPSSEPIKASMDKQEQLKQEIRLLVNITLANMVPQKQASAEARDRENQGLEAGLAFIGMELEKAERKVAEYWGMYENSTPATVHYPPRYSLKSDAERREEADHYKEMMPIIPSPTFQKTLAKLLARAMVGYRVSYETMTTIETEIEKSEFVAADPDIIQRDVELGILSKEYASDVRLYPEDNIEKANKE